MTSIYKGILDNKEITLGSQWVSSCGSIIEVVSLDNGRVTYKDVHQSMCEKDFFSFQCRYSKIVKGKK